MDAPPNYRFTTVYRRCWPLASATNGAFQRHTDVLAELGHAPVAIRAATDFRALAGLVLPGGESSVQLQLIDRLGLRAH
jgi:glutamine amidotransferase PdxT